MCHEANPAAHVHLWLHLRRLPRGRPRCAGSLAIAPRGIERQRLARLERAGSAGWQVVGGVLSKHGEVDDLVTRANYTNFELELEWKIGKAGNSGIFYRATH